MFQFLLGASTNELLRVIVYVANTRRRVIHVTNFVRVSSFLLRFFSRLCTGKWFQVVYRQDYDKTGKKSLPFVTFVHGRQKGNFVNRIVCVDRILL